MATLGNSNNPTGETWYDDTGNKEFWNKETYNMPSGGGTATGFHVYVAGHNGGINITPCIWDSNNNVYWTGGSLGVGTGLGWQFQSMPSVYLSPDNYYLGFWSSGHPIWSFESGGGVHYVRGIGSPTNNTGNNDEYSGAGYGDLAIYLDYTPGTPGSFGGVFVYQPNGTWTRHPVTVLKTDGQWHWRGIQTLDPDGTFHRRA